jgi:hypothetical protein
MMSPRGVSLVPRAVTTGQPAVWQSQDAAGAKVMSAAYSDTRHQHSTNATQQHTVSMHPDNIDSLLALWYLAAALNSPLLML